MKSTKNLFLCLSLLFLGAIMLQAQSPARFTLKGVARDTNGDPVSYATAMVLKQSDTTLVSFEATNDNGEFLFKNLKNEPYILKITYIGCLPINMNIGPVTSEVLDMGMLTLNPISEQLMEVVVRTAKAPLRIKGDTIEYDATTFKVPPGSTVEDLLRRLPGIKVDANGKIQAQGETVNRVLVDGKEFFGGDPTAATQNLGAETISKVQVYDEKSEEAKLTGVDDGNNTKALNLELKEEYKKGAFGKATLGGGTDNRWASRGNYNRFNKTQQFSVIAYGNNINQSGISWSDYREFRGQNAYSRGNEGDFGFSGGGDMFFMMGGENGVPIAGGNSSGLSDNAGVGVNYNFDNKKTKFNTSYFYNQTLQNLLSSSLRQSFLPGNTFTSSDSSSTRNFSGNHSVNSRVESELDSNNTVIVNIAYRNFGDDRSRKSNSYFETSDSNPLNTLLSSTSNIRDQQNLSTTGIYNHKFKKKGRSFSVSGAYKLNEEDRTAKLRNENQFATDPNLSQLIAQLNRDNETTEEVKGSALYNEPLGKKWFSSTFVNLSHVEKTADQPVIDLTQSRFIDSLSMWYETIVDYQRLGTSLRYAHEGLNISLGLGAQRITLANENAARANAPLRSGSLNRTYDNLIPNASVNYNSNSGFSSLSYDYQIQAPDALNLQPVTRIASPLFQSIGNPALSPVQKHTIRGNYNYWGSGNDISFGAGANYTYFENQTIYNQLIENVEGVGFRTTSMPENYQGGNSSDSYAWVDFPLVKTKLNMEVSVNAGFSKNPVYINEVQNSNIRNRYNSSVEFSLTPGSKLYLQAEFSYGVQDIRYSIQETQNQTPKNYGVDASIKWMFVAKTFFESDFDYSVYENDRLGFKQTLPIWNASIKRLVGPENKVEIRLAAFDVFNRRVQISQFGDAFSISRNTNNTLARYFLASLSYNFRGYENKLQTNNHW